jgi:radical SAM superfamily enzyme YgiQ (UPF0313 family)
MEPLGIATLAALTPPEHTRVFHDDRLEAIPYDAPTDLACLTVETYTARRSYQIAAAYRKRGVPVVLGGFHPTLVPEEAAAHADAIVLGDAEGCWRDVLADAAEGRLQPRYEAPAADFGLVWPDRSIFGKRPYGMLSLLESSRGCAFQCEFCSISAYCRRRVRHRPVEEVAAEAARLGRHLFFVDDNLATDHNRLAALCEALIPLRRTWMCQASVQVARRPDLLRLMRRSGCIGLLVGLESLQPENLRAMGKHVNCEGTDFAAALSAFRQSGLCVFATFVFGYDADTPETFERTFRFALEQRFFFAAFNHLVPFPGTPLHDRLRREGRLLRDAWWLDPDYRFGDVVFQPRHFTPEALARQCQAFRERFYSAGSILRRSLDAKANCASPLRAVRFLAANVWHGREVVRRIALPLGFPYEG